MGSVIEVHPLSDNPTAAWNEILEKKEKVIRLNVKTPKSKCKENVLRFVCMSDTHSLTKHMQLDIPDGDVFIHAGDFTRIGNKAEVEEFNSWLGTLSHKHKIVIAGNHELSFDNKFVGQAAQQQQTHKTSHTDAASLITNGKYLQDESVTICGIKIYGTPWQPEFCSWAFNLPRGEACLRKWNMIPDDTDVLITHSPPVGHGDLCCTGVRAGCVELLATVQQRVKPNYHIFGHIHEGYGVTSDGKIIFINASTCNISYKPVNPPIVFDFPIPEGFVK